MSEALRILERGYEMLWREDRVEEALIGLDPEFEWVVPNHPEGDVRHGVHPRRTPCTALRREASS